MDVEMLDFHSHEQMVIQPWNITISYLEVPDEMLFLLQYSGVILFREKRGIRDDGLDLMFRYKVDPAGQEHQKNPFNNMNSLWVEFSSTMMRYPFYIVTRSMQYCLVCYLTGRERLVLAAFWLDKEYKLASKMEFTSTIPF